MNSLPEITSPAIGRRDPVARCGQIRLVLACPVPTSRPSSALVPETLVWGDRPRTAASFWRAWAAEVLLNPVLAGIKGCVGPLWWRVRQQHQGCTSPSGHGHTGIGGHPAPHRVLEQSLGQVPLTFLPPLSPDMVASVRRPGSGFASCIGRTTLLKPSGSVGYLGRCVVAWFAQILDTVPVGVTPTGTVR